MKRLTVVLVVASFVSIDCMAAQAQATAQISGTVRDQSGAVLPGVEITATQTETGIARTTISNETGSYVLPNLAVGPYRLHASLPGFRTFAQTGIVLQVNANPVINPVLQVGQVTEQVEVQANAALVETRAQGVGQVIENAQILELPLNGRQVVELIALAGVTTPGAQTGGLGIPWNPVSFSIAGGLAQSVSYTLDGATHNNPSNNFEMPMPFPDALQEFKVDTSALSAQSGMHASGAVSVVTKAGTNDFHGNLFEFVRNYKFNARNFFARKRDTLKRNQFGGTLGGPIIANKLFFFAGYQGTVVRQDPAENTSFVPTAAMLAGDFTAVTSPACNVGRQITLRAPFVNNRLDPALLSRAALNVAAKLPKTQDPCGRVLWGGRSIQDGHQMVGRIDYQRSSNHSLFGRYMATVLDAPPPYSLSQNLLTAPTIGTDSLAQAFTFGDTYLFGSDVVNSFRLSANRSATRRIGASFFSGPDLGIRMFTYVPDAVSINVSNGFTASSGLGSGKINVGVFALNNDVSWIRGNHQLAFGASASQANYNYASGFFAPGQFVFNGQATGLGLADFLSGNVFTLVQSPPNFQVARQRYFGLYAQDTWKVSPRLTLNAGVRWEPFLPQQRLDDGVQHFDLDAFRTGTRTTKFRNAPPGLFYPGDPGFPSRAGSYNQWLNFQPRVGLAWDATGDGRMSIRAAYGLTYDYPGIQYHVNTNIAPPWVPKATARNVTFEDPWRNFPGGSPFPFIVDANAPYPPFAVYTSMRYDTHNPMISQWNLSIQRQIGSDLLISASYIGTTSVHLWTEKPMNTAVYFPGGPCTIHGVTYNPCSTVANTDQRRQLYLENPQIGQHIGHLNLVDDGGTGSYNGLLLSAQRRTNRGLTISGNYTWSHCISDPYSNNPSGFSGANGYSPPDNRRASRGNCSTSATDRRHLFNLTVVAETPEFSNRALRIVASSWRLSPIVRIQSGNFFTVTTSSDVALSGLTGQRVSQVLPDVYGDKSVQNYLNPHAFALPATGTIGNMGMASVKGPGHWTFDAALSRAFRFRETQRLELRAEAFNVTNSLRKNNPVSNFNAGNFGQITSAQDPRIMQFALKYVF